MPAHFKWKLNSMKKKKSIASKSSKKVVQKPPWDSTVTDLMAYRSTPEEVKHRHIIHKSKNAEIAKIEYLEKTLRQQNDNSLVVSEANYKCSEEKKYTTVPFVTVAPYLSASGSAYINEIATDDTDHFYWIPPDKSERPNALNEKENVSLKSNAAEVEELLLCLQKKLKINEKYEFETSATKTNNCVSNITSLFIDTLNILNQKYNKLKKELSAERKARKCLENEVEELKQLVHNVTQDMKFLNSKMKQTGCVKDHFHSNHKLEQFETPTKNSSSINFQENTDNDTSDQREVLSSLSDPVSTGIFNHTINDQCSLSNKQCLNCKNNYYSSHLCTTAIMLTPPVQLDLVDKYSS